MSIPEITLGESVEGRLLQAVKDRLEAIELPGIPNERIVVQSLAWIQDEAELPTPCIIVSPAPESTPWPEGTNELDRTMFAILVSVVLANGRDVSTRYLGTQLYWRERIRVKFQCLNIARFTELTAPTGWLFEFGSVESGDKFIDAAKRIQRDAQFFMLRFRVREPRE